MTSNGRLAGNRARNIYSIPKKPGNQHFKVRLENKGDTPFVCYIGKKTPNHETFKHSGQIFYPGHYSLITLSKKNPNIYIKRHPIGASVGSGEVNYQVQDFITA